MSSYWGGLLYWMPPVFFAYALILSVTAIDPTTENQWWDSLFALGSMYGLAFTLQWATRAEITRQATVKEATHG